MEVNSKGYKMESCPNSLSHANNTEVLPFLHKLVEELKHKINSLEQEKEIKENQKAIKYSVATQTQSLNSIHKKMMEDTSQKSISITLSDKEKEEIDDFYALLDRELLSENNQIPINNPNNNVILDRVEEIGDGINFKGKCFNKPMENSVKSSKNNEKEVHRKFDRNKDHIHLYLMEKNNIASKSTNQTPKENDKTISIENESSLKEEKSEQDLSIIENKDININWNHSNNISDRYLRIRKKVKQNYQISFWQNNKNDKFDDEMKKCRLNTNHKYKKISQIP